MVNAVTTVSPSTGMLLRVRSSAKAQLVTARIRADPFVPATVLDAVDRLVSGPVDPLALRSLCMDDPELAAVPAFDRIMRQLLTHSVLSAVERHPDGTPLVGIDPLPPSLLCSLDGKIDALDPAKEYAMSRHALIRRGEHAWQIEGPFQPTVITLHEPSLLGLISDLARPLSGDDLQRRIDAAPSRFLLPALAGTGLLGAAHDEEPLAHAQWDPHDVMFHARSRLGRHVGPYGGTRRGLGRMPPPPAVLTMPDLGRTALPRPDMAALGRTDAPLADVMESRRSIREFGASPMTKDQLGEFLFRCCRTRAAKDLPGGWEVLSRPSPGGGSVQELEVYPLIRMCDGVEPGLYHYDSHTHELCLVRPLDRTTQLLLQRYCPPSSPGRMPQAILIVTSRFDRVFWKYEAMAYALTLKNVGVLYQTMYLAAWAMGLASYALGGGDSDLFARASRRPYWAEGAVGEFAIGSRPDTRLAYPLS